MALSEELDLELIGAFIDGRLEGADRERVAKLLSESEAAFEIYAGAVAARADLGEVAGAVPIRLVAEGAPKRRRWLVATFPLAAAAAALIVLIPTLRARRGVEGLELSANSILDPLISRSTVRPLVGSSTKPQADLAVAISLGLDEQRWPVTRGGPASLMDSTVFFRLGVRATHLQAALSISDRARADSAAASILELLQSVNLSDATRAEYRDISRRLTVGDSLAQVTTATLGAEKRLQDLLRSRWFGLGKWFAAAELAAFVHSSEFFNSPESQRFLNAAIEHGDLPADDVAQLRQVAAVTRAGLSAQSFTTVQETFAGLIRRHGK